MAQIHIFVDGACKGNPGPGGWGLVGFRDGQYLYHKYQHTEVRTTNNREELKAMIEAFDDSINIYSNDQIIIYSDSAYVVNTYNKGWSRKCNLDLWKQLDEQLKRLRNVTFSHVKGHSNVKYNERCDWFAKEISESY